MVETIHIVVIIALAVILLLASLSFLPQGQAAIDPQVARTLLQGCCLAFLDPITNLCGTTNVTSVTEHECSDDAKKFSTGKIKIFELYNIVNSRERTAKASVDDIRGNLGCGCPSLGK